MILRHEHPLNCIGYPLNYFFLIEEVDFAFGWMYVNIYRARVN